MSLPIRCVLVVGAGAWGTALALVAQRSGREVVLWARAPTIVDQINRDHANPDYLPGVALDPAIRATGDLAAGAAADMVVLVTPAQALRPIAAALAPHLAAGTPALIAAKGVERGTGALMTEVVSETMPVAVPAVLSGPTFAIEVARGLPTAVTLACADPSVGAALVAALGAPGFRPYLSRDIVGAEIGGAVKNVLAIACGIVAGRGLGDNARAALITRGLAEIARLAAAKGADPRTVMGLSGLGDLALTCTAGQSRNYALGAALGRGAALADLMAGRRTVAEGVDSAGAVVALAGRLGVEMPISAAVDAILNRNVPIDRAIAALLARPFTTESDA